MNYGRYSTFIDMKKMKENALICDEKALIHQRQIDEICRIIKERMEYGEYNPSQKVKSENDVISIFARRGAGKTTFVKSLKKLIREHVNQDAFHGIDCSKLVVIDVIEPNQIQKKENFMVRFLASIHDKFLYLMDDQNKSESARRRFDEATTALYEALPIIDGVGKIGVYADWTDVDYVADNFVNLAMKAKDLERRFHEYINVALNILEKKSLLFILDDCDVNIEKTFEILETIRLYFTSPQIIVVMTGDANLYGMTVRQNYWKFFEKDFLEKEYSNSPAEDSKRAAYRKMVHRLETQYLQKMIKPEHRIFLDNVYEKYRLNKISDNNSTNNRVPVSMKYSLWIKFSDEDSEAKDIKSVYREMLNRLDLIFNNQADTDIFVNHLLRQPFRNQYRLLAIYDDFLLNTPKANRDTETAKVELTDRVLKVFEVYINQFSADNKHLMSKTSNYAAWIMKFLVDNKIVATGSHMLPNLESDSQSNALLAMAASCTRQIHTNPSIAFDFWLRVSFVRQVLLTLGEEGKQINDFAHIYHDSGISKIMGNVLAYTNAKLNSESDDQSVNTMAGVGIFEQKTPTLQGVKGQLSQLCQLVTVAQNKNETKMFSIYRLIAAIGEILKAYESIDEGNEADTLKFMRVNAIHTKMLHLSQIHYFVEPVDDNNRKFTHYSPSTKSKKRNTAISNGHAMAAYIYHWILDFRKVSKVTPYCLDRIFTRFYNNLNEVSPESLVENIEVGNCLSRYILTLWNACIVEDAIVRGELESMTLDCDGNIEETFLSNYKVFLRSGKNNNISNEDSFSAWLTSCPIFQCYVDPYILAIMKQGEEQAPVELYQYILYQQKKLKERVIKRNTSEIHVLSSKIDNILKKLNFLNSLNDVERTITLQKMEANNKKVSIEKRMQANENLKSLESQKLLLIKYAYYDENELYAQLRKLHESKDNLEEINERLHRELDEKRYKYLSEQGIQKIPKFIDSAGYGPDFLNVMNEMAYTD